MDTIVYHWGIVICNLNTYTMGDKPLAPPQPIITMAKVNVEITKLAISLAFLRSSFEVEDYSTQQNREESDWRNV